MKRLLLLATSIALGFTLTNTALPQGGGGGFGGGGGGGGFGGGGAAGGGGGFGGGGAAGGSAGAGESNAGGPAPQAVDPETAIPGDWRIEFRIERDSADPGASGRWIQVRAELRMSGTRVYGTIRDRDIVADFECSVSAEGRCDRGRLRFSTDEHDWQDFGFALDDFVADRAEGWATFVDIESGVTREYELVMLKR